MKILKYSCITLVVLLIFIMGCTTVLEKYRGTSFVSTQIYSSVWFVVLWTLLGVGSLVYILRRHLQKRPVTFLIHISFGVILLGAGVTWLWGREGELHLRGSEPVDFFEDKSAGECPLDAVVRFKSLDVICYPGTETPKSFICNLSMTGDNAGDYTVALNHVLSHNGVRYFLSSFDDDGEGVTLAVSKNCWGMGISYAGYGLMILSMATFFFCKRTRFRSLRKVATLLLLGAGELAANASPRTVSPDVADALGNLNVYFNGRVCPLNTVAIDLTLNLYKSRSYEGADANQVLAGWLFFPSEWISTVDISQPDKQQAVEMLVSTDVIKIFPYEYDGIKWASPVTRVEADVPADRRLFMRRVLDYVSEQIMTGNDDAAKATIEKIQKYQVEVAGDTLPTANRFKAELLYNRLPLSFPMAIFCFLSGVVVYIFVCRNILGNKKFKGWQVIVVKVVITFVLAVLTFMIGLRWYLSGHLPMTNGFETMQCMAWCALIGTLIFSKRMTMAAPFGLLVASMALMVAMMGEKNPAITYIQPVLYSPWLCIHVMLVMISYSLLAFAMLGGITGVIMKIKGKEGESLAIAHIDCRLLYPAVFTLAAGIFVGAIWANETWGRFWGWDPKEVWALITMLIYSGALHGGFGWFRKGGVRLHIYCIVAFLSVAVTYFGVNYFLGGLHSYA